MIVSQFVLKVFLVGNCFGIGAYCEETNEVLHDCLFGASIPQTTQFCTTKPLDWYQTSPKGERRRVGIFLCRGLSCIGLLF